MSHGNTLAPTVGLILLAAGASRRLGAPKQLLSYQGESLLRRAAHTALASVCRPVVAVLGAHRESVRSEIADLPLEIIVNEEWSSGMGASIRVGLQHLAATVDAVVIMLCDQPLVGAALIDRLAAVYRAGNAPLIASKYNATHGVPALFDRRLYPALLALEGAQGAKKVILAHSGQRAEVYAPEAAHDVDTLADYQGLCAPEAAGRVGTRRV